jgi:hypothetical protein
MADIAGNRPAPYRRPSDVWLHVLDGAQTEAEIVAAARDYLAMWTPHEISRIPEGCRPGKICGSDDISDLAFRLTNGHLDYNGGFNDRLLFERIMSFFVHANARLALLRGGPPGPPPADRTSRAM